MNTMTQLANIPSAIFPHKDQTFATADEWYLVLAELHLAQLVFQHNEYGIWERHKEYSIAKIPLFKIATRQCDDPTKR